VINTPTNNPVLTVNSVNATWTSNDTAQAGVTASGVNDAQTSCSLVLLPSTTISSGTCAGSAKTFSNLANGSYTLTVTVRDNAGNIATPVTRNFSVAVVDNVGPSINITQPTEGQTLASGTVVANWILTDQAQVGVTPVGVDDSQTTCVLTSGATTIVPSGPCTGLTKTFTGLANANYTLSITAKDTLGNSTTTPRNFTVGQVDNQGPTINITNPTAGQTITTNSITAAWALSDTAQAGVTPSGVNDAQTTCSLVLLPSTTISSGACAGGSKAFSNLANGNYTLTVVAKDNVGNTSTLPRNFTVAVPDTVAPRPESRPLVSTTRRPAARWCCCRPRRSPPAPAPVAPRRSRTWRTAATR
jgi:hypothetical protein